MQSEDTVLPDDNERQHSMREALRRFSKELHATGTQRLMQR